MERKYPIALTGTQIKWIALVTMIIDHTGLILMKGTAWYGAFRWIGRISFPLYCFLLVEGFCHTRDIGKYMRRLAGWAILSELPYDWMYCEVQGGMVWTRALWNHQNVLFTLLLGLIALEGYVRLQNRGKRELAFLWCVAMAVGALIGRTDYSWAGVALICFLYRFRQEHGYRFLSGYSTLVLGVNPNEYPAVISFALMECYNGQKGKAASPWLFYLSYPLHLCILCILRLIL
jgi:hypothetical protein